MTINDIPNGIRSFFGTIFGMTLSRLKSGVSLYY